MGRPASWASPREAVSSIVRQAASVAVCVSVQVHEELMYKVKCLYEYLYRTQSALDLSKDGESGLENPWSNPERSWTIIDYVAPFLDQMDRFGSSELVDKRLRNVKYNLNRKDVLVDLVKNVQLSREMSFFRRNRLLVQEKRVLRRLK